LGRILSLVGALLCVVAILFFTYWATRRIGSMSAPAFSSMGKHMRIVDRLVLAQDKQIVLAQIGERWCVIGISPNGIQLLLELTQEETALWQADTANATQAASGGFGEILRQTLRNRGSGK